MMSNKILTLMTVGFLLLVLSCHAEEKRLLSIFEGTKAYSLAKAVILQDIGEIRQIVREDSTLLYFSEPSWGTSVLVLSIHGRKFRSFKELLAQGANPNLLNPITKTSPLIESIRPYGSQFEWVMDFRFAEELLKAGADPNYAIERDFTDVKGHFHTATSPLMKASRLDLEVVKILLQFGADPNKRVGENQASILSNAISSRKFDIVYYYIDSLKVNVHEPLLIRTEDSLYVQDFTQRYMNYEEGSENFQDAKRLVEHLERMGVEFDNYNYRLE